MRTNDVTAVGPSDRVCDTVHVLSGFHRTSVSRQPHKAKERRKTKTDLKGCVQWLSALTLLQQVSLVISSGVLLEAARWFSNESPPSESYKYHFRFFFTAGVLSLLSEPEDEIKVFALQRLDELVDDFWAEVADRITEL